MNERSVLVFRLPWSKSLQFGAGFGGPPLIVHLFKVSDTVQVLTVLASMMAASLAMATCLRWVVAVRLDAHGMKVRGSPAIAWQEITGVSGSELRGSLAGIRVITRDRSLWLSGYVAKQGAFAESVGRLGGPTNPLAELLTRQTDACKRTGHS